jgi:hypothetical protein
VLRDFTHIAPVLAALAIVSSAGAATFTWDVPTGGAWDNADNWAASPPAHSNDYPNAPGSVAVIPTIPITNRYGTVSIWPNQETNHFVTTVGSLVMCASNEVWCGTARPDGANVIVFNNAGGDSVLAFTNTAPCPSDWWAHVLGMRYLTGYVLSNDLRIAVVSQPGVDARSDYAAVWFVDAAFISGAHDIVKTGAGRLVFGGQYPDGAYAAPGVHTEGTVHVHEGVCDIAHGAAIAPPIVVHGATRYEGGVTQYVFGTVRQFSEAGLDIDLVMNGGAYYANYLGCTHLTNAGDMTVLAPSFLLVSDYGAGGSGTELRHAVFTGDVRGTNALFAMWGGTVTFTGSISPGFDEGSNRAATLRFSSATDDRIALGSGDTPLRLNIDLEGEAGVSGRCSDLVELDGSTCVLLDRLDVAFSVHADMRGMTCQFLATDGQLTGTLNSVTWSPPAASGTVLYLSNGVAVTDVLIPEPCGGGAAALLIALLWSFAGDRSQETGNRSRAERGPAERRSEGRRHAERHVGRDCIPAHRRFTEPDDKVRGWTRGPKTWFAFPSGQLQLVEPLRRGSWRWQGSVILPVDLDPLIDCLAQFSVYTRFVVPVYAPMEEPGAGSHVTSVFLRPTDDLEILVAGFHCWGRPNQHFQIPRRSRGDEDCKARFIIR